VAGMALAMGATLRGTQSCLAKIKNFIYSSLSLYFAPHTTSGVASPKFLVAKYLTLGKKQYFGWDTTSQNTK